MVKPECLFAIHGDWCIGCKVLEISTTAATTTVAEVVANGMKHVLFCIVNVTTVYFGHGFDVCQTQDN
jgi:hypothetical protein